jgi:putative restriction endonuclease
VTAGLIRVTGIDLASAERQLEQLLQRPAAVPGRRQSAFLAVETILCLAAMRTVNHRRFGGTTAHLAEHPVPDLSRLFRRPPSSILAKMANLDGSRPNGARWERPAAEALLSDGAIGLERAYSIVIVAARRAGVDESMLPDFLRP